MRSQAKLLAASLLCFADLPAHGTNKDEVEDSFENHDDARQLHDKGEGCEHNAEAADHEDDREDDDGDAAGYISANGKDAFANAPGTVGDDVNTRHNRKKADDDIGPIKAEEPEQEKDDTAYDR